jgi:hypothetical protein
MKSRQAIMTMQSFRFATLVLAALALTGASVGCAGRHPPKQCGELRCFATRGRER